MNVSLGQQCKPGLRFAVLLCVCTIVNVSGSPHFNKELKECGFAVIPDDMTLKKLFNDMFGILGNSVEGFRTRVDHCLHVFIASNFSIVHSGYEL